MEAGRGENAGMSGLRTRGAEASRMHRQQRCTVTDPGVGLPTASPAHGHPSACRSGQPAGSPGCTQHTDTYSFLLRTPGPAHPRSYLHTQAGAPQGTPRNREFLETPRNTLWEPNSSEPLPSPPIPCPCHRLPWILSQVLRMLGIWPLLLHVVFPWASSLTWLLNTWALSLWSLEAQPCSWTGPLGCSQRPRASPAPARMFWNPRPSDKEPGCDFAFPISPMSWEPVPLSLPTVTALVRAMVALTSVRKVTKVTRLTSLPPSHHTGPVSPLAARPWVV